MHFNDVTIALLIQAAAFIFYGGMTYQMIREHERRISHLEKWREEGSA